MVRSKKSKEVQGENQAEASAKVPVHVPVAETDTVIAETGGNSKKKKRVIIVAFLVLLVLFAVAAVAAGYFYIQLKKPVPAAGTAEVKEIEQITEVVSKLMELPNGTPTLATVTDKSKLANQPFFQKAENGDKVLLFAEAKRAVLYRPSTGKIVDVTTINVNQPAATVPAAYAPATVLENTIPPADPATVATPEVQSAKIALYNGSSKVGVTNTLDDEIKVAFPDVEIVAKEKAAKSDYQGNLIIDLSGKNADLAKKLADSFGGTVGTLPVGEVTPVSDILIIIGNKV